MIVKDDKTLKGTTCFSEHKKYRIPCEKTSCRYWHEMDDTQNCTLISASNGPKTLQEIGDVFGITRMRVCQIEKGILSKLSKKQLEEAIDV